jgi:hypothetical protein
MAELSGTELSVALGLYEQGFRVHEVRMEWEARMPEEGKKEEKDHEERRKRVGGAAEEESRKRKVEKKESVGRIKGKQGECIRVLGS